MTKKISLGNKVQYANILFGVFILIYTFIIIYLAFIFNIWEDEAFSLSTSSNNLQSVIKLSYNFEGQPPVYFLLLAIWRLIDQSIFFARLLSIIFIGLGAIYFYKFSTILSDKKISKWMVVLFLLNPFTIWSALEIRLYSLAILLSIAIIYNFLKFQKEGNKKHIIYFLFLSIIGTYTQYFFTIEIAALAISILILKGWKDFYKNSIWFVIIAILFLPNLYFLSSQINMAQSEKLNYTFISQAKNVLQSIQNFLLALNLIKLDIALSILVRIILLIVLGVSYFKFLRNQKSNNINKDQFNSLFLTTTIILFFYILIFGIFGLLFQLKYLALLFPLFLVHFLLIENYSPKLKNILFAIFSIFYLIIAINRFSVPIKLYDYEKISKYIEEVEKKNEPIVFYRKDITFPMQLYYQGYNPLIPLVDLNIGPDYYKNDLKNTNDLKNHINMILDSTKSILLLTNRIESFIFPNEMNQEMFDHFINFQYQIGLDTTFLQKEPLHFLRVRRLYKLKQGHNY